MVSVEELVAELNKLRDEFDDADRDGRLAISIRIGDILDLLQDILDPQTHLMRGF